MWHEGEENTIQHCNIGTLHRIRECYSRTGKYTDWCCVCNWKRECIRHGSRSMIRDRSASVLCDIS